MLRVRQLFLEAEARAPGLAARGLSEVAPKVDEAREQIDLGQHHVERQDHLQPAHHLVGASTQRLGRFLELELAGREQIFDAQGDDDALQRAARTKLAQRIQERRATRRGRLRPVARRPAVSSRMAWGENHQSQLRVPAVPRTLLLPLPGGEMKPSPDCVSAVVLPAAGGPIITYQGKRVQRGLPAARARAACASGRRWPPSSAPAGAALRCAGRGARCRLAASACREQLGLERRSAHLGANLANDQHGQEGRHADHA